MADPFVAEIRMFPFNFAPKGWMPCDGRLLPISQNTALFSLLGTYYGGDGKSTFALPDLMGRTPMGAGQGPGLSLYDLGQSGGSETVSLQATEMPPHTHPLSGVASIGTTDEPTGPLLAQSSIRSAAYAPTSNTTMAATAVTTAGSGAPHNNMSAYLTFGFYIATQGVFPPRT